MIRQRSITWPVNTFSHWPFFPKEKKIIQNSVFRKRIYSDYVPGCKMYDAEVIYIICSDNAVRYCETQDRLKKSVKRSHNICVRVSSCCMTMPYHTTHSQHKKNKDSTGMSVMFYHILQGGNLYAHVLMKQVHLSW